jgi:FSR family fosmidomycin resistance protein-like MFS transporter
VDRWEIGSTKASDLVIHLGSLLYALALPYVGLAWTAVLSVFIGLIMASAFPAILV